MKVAIDSGPLKSGHSFRGVGVSTKGLIESLLKYNTGKDIRIDAVDFNSSDLSGYDILHYTSFNPYFLSYPRIGSVKAKTVVHIHDLIPLIYQDHYQAGIKGLVRYQYNKYLLKKADAIITVSETSKKDIIRFLSIDPEKVKVVYWACDQSFKNVSKHEDLTDLQKLYKLPHKFVLYVGDVNYNKNISTLIKACKIARIHLVIVGKQAVNIDGLTETWKNLSGPRDLIRSILGISHPELKHFKELSNLIKNNNVITVGYVPKEDLPGIYSLASVYCQPSYYEGFGLPVLEAFFCETPVVISKTQALKEIANGAALIADPNSPQDFADKILSLSNYSTQKLHLIRAGRSRAKEFSWEETAEKTMDVYKRVTSI